MEEPLNTLLDKLVERDDFISDEAVFVQLNELDELKKMLGKEIENISLVVPKSSRKYNGPDELVISFTDGSALSLYDDGQTCCESRYLTTDDALETYAGSTLLDIKVLDSEVIDDPDGDCHEVQFLRIYTSKGVLVAETHNEHNGYYGGFDLRCSCTFK